MTRLKALTSVLCLLVGAAVCNADVIRVPEDRSTISEATLYAQDGDIISVWGPPPDQPNDAPPYMYRENIDYEQKRITIINRSFMPDWPDPGHGCAPSWDSVVIDGSGSSASTVTMDAIPTEDGPIATLEGFTVENGSGNTDGLGCCGGGVHAYQSSVALVQNWIKDNCASTAGGGVYMRSGEMPVKVILDHNRIENNLCDGGGGNNAEGGGLMLHDDSYTSITVENNVFESNWGEMRGGGICLRRNGGIASNKVLEYNTISDNTSPCGAGIYAEGWVCPVRRNVITNNLSDGVYTVHANEYGTLDLGTVEDPGYNVLMNNGDCDLYIDPLPQSVPCIDGDYWGTLDYSTIEDHIKYPPPQEGPYPKVIAASSRWFSVTASSTCETNVIVTGDLLVDDAALEIGSESESPGRLIEFLKSSDFTFTGGDPSRCGLYVLGADASLTATGTQTHPTIFKSRPDQGQEQPGDWRGIFVGGTGAAELSHCEVRSAYAALKASDADHISVQNSSIHDNQYCGIQTYDTDVLVSGDTIFSNAVYGIRCEGLHAGTSISDNGLYANGIGISCADYQSQGQINPSIDNNRVVGSPTISLLNLYGIELQNIGVHLSLTGNSVRSYPQAGVVQDGSSAPMEDDKIISVGYDGLRCLGLSLPVVRWTTIDTCAHGVFVDESALPDLGTLIDPGDNSILLGNTYYVYNLSAALVHAEWNWWGTCPPVNAKFYGGVDHANPLTEPPERDGGGGQSKAITAQPATFGMLPPRPSPCREMAVVSYSLAQPGRFVLNLYDISGRRISILAQGSQTAGPHSVDLNVARLGLASGVYVLRFEAEGKTISRRLIVQ